MKAGDPAVDVSVDFTVAEKKSLESQTKGDVQNALVSSTDTSISDDTDSNSVLSGSASIGVLKYNQTRISSQFHIVLMVIPHLDSFLFFARAKLLRAKQSARGLTFLIIFAKNVEMWSMVPKE